MKTVNLDIQFHDEHYAELEELAEEMNCSVVEIIGEFIRDGFADWTWVHQKRWEREKIQETRKKLVKRFR